MRYVTCYGEVYKLKDAAYKRFLTEWLKNRDAPWIAQYGVLVGATRDITEWNIGRVEEELQIISNE